MKLYIFARWHARDGQEREIAEVLRRQVPRVRAEPGCLAIDAFGSTRDPRLFFIHSCWKDEAAFEVHAALPDTAEFLERMGRLIDHPFDISRTHTL